MDKKSCLSSPGGIFFCVLILTRGAWEHTRSILPYVQGAREHAQDILPYAQEARVHAQDILPYARGARVHAQSILPYAQGARVHAQSILPYARGAWANMQKQRKPMEYFSKTDIKFRRSAPDSRPKPNSYLLYFFNTWTIFDGNYQQMRTKKQVLLPRFLNIFEQVGENIKLARKRRKLTTVQVAERAGIDRSTLYHIEKGNPSVSMGAYFNVLRVLGIQDDFLKLAADDEFGRKLQDLELLKK